MFALILLCDQLKKHVPHSQPMRGNHDFLAQIFTLGTGVMHLPRILIGSLC